MPVTALIPDSQPELRPARDSDGLAVAALIAACFGEYPGCLFSRDEFPELHAPARWALARGTRMWVIDGPDGTIAGCICATPDGQGAVELHKFYLASNLRGSGLAQNLMTKVFELASETNATMIFLWTDTRFTRAHRFYEKLGFARQPQTRLLGDISNTEEFFYTLKPATSP
ncbi:MAG: GNAT family N-acetyltransferase [Bosea sp. (in: a-proteobacteria)]